MIPDAVRKAGPYNGDGTTVDFPFSFKVFDATDIAVLQTDTSGVETPLDSGYTVALNGDQDTSPGGVVSLGAAPGVGFKITIVGSLAAYQPMQLTNAGGFFPTVLNDSADRAVILVQQLLEQVARTVKVPSSDGLEVPALPAVEARKGNILGFSAIDGNFEMFPKNDFTGPVGPRGPQGYSVATLAQLKAAPTTDGPLNYDGAVFTFRTDDPPYTADDINIVKSDDVDLSVGAWVRQEAASIQTNDGSTVQNVFDRHPIQVDAYYQTADGDDWAPAFTRAYAAGIAQHRDIIARASGAYRFLSSVDVWPDASGWTPACDGQGSTVTLGHATPVLADEAAGWRVRGIRSGALANSIGFELKNFTVDHQSINLSNGTRAVWMENASAWKISNVNAINVKMGYHIANYRYIDGGHPASTQPGVVEHFDASGFVLTSTADQTWYPYSDSGDLATKFPGQTMAAGTTELISVVQPGNTGNGTPRLATPTLFRNDTAGTITIPSTLTVDALTGAGLTNLGTTAAWQSNSAMPAVPYIYYSSGGTKTPRAGYPGNGNVLRDVTVYGSRYGAYVSGAVGPVFQRVIVDSGIRGLAAEWSVTNGTYESCQAINPLSSGFLLGYGCSGWTVNDNLVSCLSDRWIGEGLYNFQLSSGNLYGRRNRTVTRSNNTPNAVGQCHIHIALDCSNVDFECDMTGDCSKAYVAIESAWNTAVTAVPELYATAAGYQGGASKDMTNIKISGSITPQSDKATGAGATMIALMQVADEVNGEIGLSRVDISNLKAGTSKIPVRYLKIYEGSTAAKQVNDCLLENVEFPTETVPSTAAVRMVLPRGWAHFRRVNNVSNLDDNVERAVPDVATPNLTFGKYWQDTGSTALSGILGGQGASSSEGYEGREIIVRGNNSRAWTTISGASGTKDGLRLTGSPITPTNVQRMRLTFNRALLSWIGGLV